MEPKSGDKPALSPMEFEILQAKAAVAANTIHSAIAKATVDIIRAHNSRALAEALDQMRRVLSEQASILERFRTENTAGTNSGPRHQLICD